MSEYTPGDVEIRSAYIERQWNAAAILSDVSGPWFDRWLAAYAEQVRADEQERCARIADAMGPYVAEISPGLRGHAGRRDYARRRDLSAQAGGGVSGWGRTGLMGEGRHLGDRYFTDNTYPGYADSREYAGPDGLLNNSDVHSGSTFESYADRRATPAHRAETPPQRLQAARGRDRTVNVGVDGGGHISERQTGVQRSSIGGVSDGRP